MNNREFVFNHESKENVDYSNTRRSIYLPVIRNHLHPVFALFDYSDASVLNGDRQTSTVPTQALFLMNSPFIDEQTTNLAKNIVEGEPDIGKRINLLYETSYGRLPTDTELARISSFLEQFPDVWRSEHPEASSTEVELAAWQALCHATLAANEFTYLR
ncbi:MAG: DUF1553 domain-containing protein [Planctomycetaceae bacterium]